MSQREIVQLWDMLDELYDAYLRYRERTGRTAYVRAEHVPFLETRMRTFDVYAAVGHISNFEHYTGLRPFEFENINDRLARSLLHSATHASPISGQQRLFVFMRFVTHGYSFAAIAEKIHCGKATVISTVYEVADAIREVSFAEAFPPFTTADLEDIALKTQQRFDYPRAVAFMDGKLINIKRPAHSGTQYYNYKKNYSIILLALVDCDYRILAFDVGAPGRVGDAGVYRRSNIKVLHNLLARRKHALEFVERYPIPPQELVTMQDENPQSPRRGALAASKAREQITTHYDNLYGVRQ